MRWREAVPSVSDFILSARDRRECIGCGLAPPATLERQSFQTELSAAHI
jgi:hypothetical protein